MDKVETGLDMHNRVTGEMLSHMLRLQLKALKEHPEMAKSIPPLMVWGAPGLGKSSILQQAAREEGIGFIDVRLAQREPVDIRGLPVPGPDGVKWLVSDDFLYGRRGGVSRPGSCLSRDVASDEGGKLFSRLGDTGAIQRS